MKRELPFLSPLSIAFTVVVLAVLGFSVWRHGGLSFSPGPVTAQTRVGVSLQGFNAHADFEEQCGLCHQPLTAAQADLCLNCHVNVQDQRVSSTGTHGRIDPEMACYNCHPEHEGRNFDPVAYAVSHFDHNQTRLSLTGEHAALDCAACHVDSNYQLDYLGCADCHAEPVVHAGMFAQSCDTCHTDLSWHPAMIANQAFDHNQTRFSLARHPLLSAGGNILCSSCHPPNTTQADVELCTVCHTNRSPAFMDSHLQEMGPDCLQCHDGVDRMDGFDHAAVFPLDGQHGELACSACHSGFRFLGTPGACSDCHAEPEIHAGSFGTQCQRCHTTQAWTPALLTQHTFPLDHGSQVDLSCQTCHPVSYPGYSCFACHEHQPDEIADEHREEGISIEELGQCAQCHPTGREEEGQDDDD